MYVYLYTSYVYIYSAAVARTTSRLPPPLGKIFARDRITLHLLGRRAAREREHYWVTSSFDLRPADILLGKARNFVLVCISKICAKIAICVVLIMKFKT